MKNHISGNLEPLGCCFGGDNLGTKEPLPVGCPSSLDFFSFVSSASFPRFLHLLTSYTPLLPLTQLSPDKKKKERRKKEEGEEENRFTIQATMSFPYKCALLVGATSGIGAGLADKLVSEGIKVIAVGRRQDRLDAFVEKHGAEKAAAVRFDITDKEAMDAFVDGYVPSRLPT
jgi:hypothetical protein